MLTQDDTEGIGNTIDAIPSKRHRKWFFTWNNYTREDIDTLTHYFQNDIYRFQEEEGIASNIKHLQGCIEFKNARTFQALKNKFPKVHWEITRNPEAAMKYCCKEETRVGKIYENIYSQNISQKKNFKTKNFSELYEWQKSVLTIIEQPPDDRTIHWIWEPEGCSGKTTLIKYILKHYDEATYSCACKSADILSIADETKNIYLLNFTRNQEGYCPWSALEQLKDGLISDSKLKKKSINIVMDSPHVICFANWEPDTSKLSEDRWCIINIEGYTVKSEE